MCHLLHLMRIGVQFVGDISIVEKGITAVEPAAARQASYAQSVQPLFAETAVRLDQEGPYA